MNTQKFSLWRSSATLLVGAALLGAGLQPGVAQTVATTAENPAPQISPLGLAVERALTAKLGRNAAALDFYRSRGFEPVWFAADGAAMDRAITLLAFLDRAGEHALPATRYDAAGLRAILTKAGASPDAIARAEAALTSAYLTYARDVSSGLLEPREIDRELVLKPQRPDPHSLLSRASSGDMTAHLAELAPNSANYQRLMRHYAAFRSIARSDLWGDPVPRGRTLRPGDRHARVEALRNRLTAMGDYAPDGESAGTAGGTQIATAETANDAAPAPVSDPRRFDQGLSDAVRRFQERHGLNPDGAVGPATLAAINVSPETRANQIVVNLERLRWLNHDLGERHILVNLAGFTMDVMRGDVSEFSSRVVVGKARKHRTPEFSEEMTHMVVNPSWYVPTSIARDEILPKLENDPDYLSKRGMRMVNGRIIQRPGRGNALGRVKFMFPNRHAIYLHDTPSRRLFNRDIRAYSHGCVRVAKPLEFAAYLLTGQEEDPAGAFDRWLRRGKERRVNLQEPLPVHLTYRTAWVSPDGTNQFRGDIYGRDKKVAQALERAGVRTLN